MKKRIRKKIYNRWKNWWPAPCLENCNLFLKTLKLKPWKGAYIWRPKTRWAEPIHYSAYRTNQYLEMFGKDETCDSCAICHKKIEEHCEHLRDGSDL